MNHVEYSVTSLGKSLYAQSWSPTGQPKAAVALIHGFGEHSGRYDHVAERFVESGFALAGIDLPGHGRTEGKRGHASMATLLQAIADHVDEMRRRFPSIPVFIYGHSLGGGLTLRFVLERRPDIAGAIASSPLVSLSSPPRIKAAMAGILKRLFPSLILANPLDLSALSRDPRTAEALKSDALYHNKVSAQLGYDILRMKAWFDGISGAFPSPLLVMQGTADRIVIPQSTIDLASRLTGDVTLRIWEDFYHELHNEPERAEVIALMIAWAEKRI